MDLLLSYPLKTVSLNLFWLPVMDALSKGHFLPLDDICSIIGDRRGDKVELFLNDLVRRGFLEQTGVAQMETLPSISVIIPVYNRPGNISACLDSLLRLDYPENKLEIIVVDDASTDETPDVVSRYPVKLVRNERNRQAPYCRNLGAQKAQGEILAFLDSDCLASSAWLRELVPAFKDRKIAAIGGMVAGYHTTRPLDRYEQVRSSLMMGRWPKRSTDNNPYFYVPSCNLLVRTDIFRLLGGFSESLLVGEDVDLCWRIRERGRHIDYIPSGTVYHKHRNRIPAFCRRRFDYGTSEPLLSRLYPHKKKQMLFSTSAFLFWTTLILSVLFGSVGLSMFSCVIVAGDMLHKFSLVRHKQLNLPLTLVGISVLRSTTAFFYHCCAFFSRYYLIFTVVLFPLLPVPAAILLGMHVLTGIVEFFIKRPELTPVRFFFYFTLEQLSYQSGVWWQCLKMMSFKAINPSLTKPRFWKYGGSN